MYIYMCVCVCVCVCVYKIELNPKSGTCYLKIIELHSWKEALEIIFPFGELYPNPFLCFL